MLFRSPGSGSVKLDEVEASRIERGDIGTQIGYLSQNPFLFPGTIAENIARLGKADMRDIIQAAELAGAHQFILDLQDGYETRVDRGGRNLSGGQRQLIALAAALFARPRLLLLDEPTTALDDNGVAHIGDLMDVLRRNGITTFIVSHEREILSRADAILALADGQIKVVPVPGRTSIPASTAPEMPEISGNSGAVPPVASRQPAPADGQMRITPKQIVVPNPDAPRPIVEKNSAAPSHPAAVKPDVTMPEIADFGSDGVTGGSARAEAAKQAAGIAKPKMVPQPTPGGTMMTMRPVAEKQADVAASKSPSPMSRTASEKPKSPVASRPAMAKRPAAKTAEAEPSKQKPLSTKRTVREQVQLTAAERKKADAQAVMAAREAAASRMRQFREDAEREAAKRDAKRPRRAIEQPVDTPPARPRGVRPQLRVVEGSAQRRRGGA